MKLSSEIDIDADRETVWDAFADFGERPRWQSGLTGVTRLSGEDGALNSSYRLSFEHDGRRFDALESITEVRRPDFLAVIVEDDASRSLVVNTFTQTAADRTRWALWSNTRFRGLAKLGALFRAGSKRERTEYDMHRFKLMVESEDAGRAA